jgi:hypothetical protein
MDGFMLFPSMIPLSTRKRVQQRASFFGQQLHYTEEPAIGKGEVLKKMGVRRET